MGPPCPLVFQMSFSSLQTSFGPRNTRNHVQAQGDAQEVPRRPIFLATVTCSREDGDSLGSGLAEGGDYRHVVSQTDCSFLHYCDRLARGAGFWPCTVDSARPASRSHMSQGTLASASKRSGRHTARAKKSGPLTPPCPNHPRWRRGVLPKQEARGSRRPRRCRGRARGQGRTGRTQRRSQLKARWPVDRDKTLYRFCPAWESKNFVSRARNTPLRSGFLSAWEARVSWSCSARPARVGFPERSGGLPAPEIPGTGPKPRH